MALNNVFSSIEGSAQFIKNQSAYADYYAGFGWFGLISNRFRQVLVSFWIFFVGFGACAARSYGWLSRGRGLTTTPCDPSEPRRPQSVLIFVAGFPKAERVPKHYEVPLGAREHDVDPPLVLEEADAALVARVLERADAREDHDVLLALDVRVSRSVPNVRYDRSGSGRVDLPTELGRM